MERIEKTLAKTLVSQREAGEKHLPYEAELEFFNLIRNGDIERLKRYTISLTREGLGKLSSNPIRNIRYHLIIAIAMTTRFCLESGLDLESAYTLSDLYIQKADICQSIEELELLHKEMVFGFANRMKDFKKQKRYSKNIIKCFDYIYEHIHESIYIEDLAEYLKLSKAYLCTLFKKETGLTIANYIQEQRISFAKNLLTYSDYTSVEIANYFNFNSQSHFIRVFKKHTNMTPKQYRDKYYCSQWQ